jgi:uncharacterized protein YjbI with pentapeptide repeats
LARRDEFFIAKCHAQVYEGDTALHAAAFAYDVEITRNPGRAELVLTELRFAMRHRRPQTADEHAAARLAQLDDGRSAAPTSVWARGGGQVLVNHAAAVAQADRVCDGGAVTEPTPHHWPTRRPRVRAESWWWIATVVLVPVIAMTGLAVWLLTATTRPTQAADQINLIKTALAVGAGTGGLITLILASRRQWHSEQAQHQIASNAAKQRITELYGKAADQLGADKAPVRLAGLYALERLAQDNPGQRQTIVNVLCAYLRMPYVPPPERPPGAVAPDADHVRFETRTQEGQVRLTAVSILATHLRPVDRDKHPLDTFWPDIDLDLTGATLSAFTVKGCHIRAAVFAKTHFVDQAEFTGAHFEGVAVFTDAHFDGEAQFSHAEFHDEALFYKTEFRDAIFGNAVFRKVVLFDEARFNPHS